MKTYSDTLDDQMYAARVLDRGAAPLLPYCLHADAYFVTTEFLALVTHAAQQLGGEEALSEHDFVSPHGWVTFESPTLLPFRDAIEDHDQVDPALTASWREIFSTELSVGMFWTTTIPASVFMIPFLASTTPYGDLNGFTIPFDTPDTRDITRWFKAFWLLTSQHGVSETVEHTPSRPARKRAERANVNPLVRVIRLPRHVRAQSSAEHGHVDWQSRWIVSGHWRQQPWGPERKRIRPVWIAPYVKGPDDRPLKASARRLFVVGDTTDADVARS